ncbi:MAG TPA: hypothetical protein VIQ76_09970 [Propionibacteriaceae bacterium]
MLAHIEYAVGYWPTQAGPFDPNSFQDEFRYAHDPTVLALGFGDAAAMVEAHGFRPGRHPYDFWRR